MLEEQKSELSLENPDNVRIHDQTSLIQQEQPCSQQNFDREEAQSIEIQENLDENEQQSDIKKLLQMYFFLYGGFNAQLNFLLFSQVIWPLLPFKLHEVKLHGGITLIIWKYTRNKIVNTIYQKNQDLQKKEIQNHPLICDFSKQIYIWLLIYYIVNISLLITQLTYLVQSYQSRLSEILPIDQEKNLNQIIYSCLGIALLLENITQFSGIYQLGQFAYYLSNIAMFLIWWGARQIDQKLHIYFYDHIDENVQINTETNQKVLQISMLIWIFQISMNVLKQRLLLRFLIIFKNYV